MLMTTLLTLSLIASTSGSPEATPEAEVQAPASELARLAADEVEGLHDFFHDWFVAELPDTDEAYARFVDALAEDFTIITPSGAVSNKEGLIALLRESHGSGKERGVKIWIRGFQVRWELGDMVLVNYEEWQELGTTKTGRVSSALLKRDPSAPGGMVWLHLHETWLPRPAVEAMLSDE